MSGCGPNFIDFSQYALWMKCPWAWYEKYVNKREKWWPPEPRSDALAIGSLVHNGLENWYARQDPTIDSEVEAKINPTPETARLCRKLVYGYVQAYPQERWTNVHAEEPLRFKLGGDSGKDGLAKLDLYFHVEEPTVVESGLPGYEITLRPGWWIQEYKTKSPHVPIADFMKGWVNNMQADFQMLALRHCLQAVEAVDVCGLLVNVIEKPREYVPKRKCQQCQQYWPYASWTSTSGKMSACPQCGHEQALKPLEQMQDQDARYFRIIVERTPERLEQALWEITRVADTMRLRASTEIFDGLVPNRQACFDSSKAYGKECEYFKPHTYGLTTIDNSDYKDTEDYIGAQ